MRTIDLNDLAPMKRILPVILFIAFCSGKDIRPRWMYSTDTFSGKVVQWGFVHNERVSIHFMGGSLLAGGMYNSYVGLSPKTTLLIITGIGVGWEVFQAWPFVDHQKVRQSERYWFDTAGDAIAAGLGALLVVRGFGKINLLVNRNQLQIHWPL